MRPLGCAGASAASSTNIIQRAIYSGTILVEMEPEDYDRLDPGQLRRQRPLHPDRGVTVGNSFKSSIELTNTIELAGSRPRPSPGPPSVPWDTDHLRKANFAYKWQAEEKDIHHELSLGGIPRPGGKPVSASTARVLHDTVAAEEAFPLPSPGINQPVGDATCPKATPCPRRNAGASRSSRAAASPR